MSKHTITHGTFKGDKYVSIPAKIVNVAGQSNGPGRGTFSLCSAPNQSQYGAPYTLIQQHDWESQFTDPFQIMYDNVRALQKRDVTPDFGIELSLGQYLDGVQHDFAITKYGIGSTTLAVEWNPSGSYPTSPAGGPNLFTQYITRLKLSQTVLNGTLAAIVWLQGESDSLDTNQASAYEANLINFIQKVRLSFPSVPFIINRISLNLSVSPFNSTIRTAQANVCNNTTGNTPLCTLMNCDDIPLNSGLHFTPDGYITMGVRAGGLVQTALGL